MYSALRIATCGGRKWWLLNLSTIPLFLWTHAFSVYFLAAEFVFLFWSIGPRRVLLLVWAPLVGASTASIFLWLMPAMVYVTPGKVDTDYQIPSLAKVVVGFLGNDAILVSIVKPPSLPNLPFLTPIQNSWLQAIHPVADTALCAGFGLALVLAAVSLLTRRTRMAAAPTCRTDPVPREDDQRTGVALLLCVAVLPVLQILLLTLFWRPVFETRYVLYCSFPLYLLLAAALLRIRRPALFGTALAAILLLYTYQIAIFATATTRSDWVSAAKQIRADLRRNDLVLVTGILPFGRELFSLNAGDLPAPVEPAYTPQEICERVPQWLAASGAASEDRPRVWAVLEGIWQNGQMISDCFDASLKPLGISHVSWSWPGWTGMRLYLFEKTGDAPPNTGVRCAFDLPLNYGQILDRLGPRVAGLDRNATLNALRRVLYWPFPDAMKWNVLLSLMLTEKGSPEVGLAVARSVLDKEPAAGFGHFAEATALAVLGSQQEAYAAFQKAFSLDRVFLSVFEPTVRARFGEHDIDKARNELDKLKSIGYPTRALSSVLSGYRQMVP
jgi:hypothetical protein